MQIVLLACLNTLRQKLMKMLSLVDSLREQLNQGVPFGSQKMMEEYADELLELEAMSEKTALRARELGNAFPASPLKNGIHKNVLENFKCEMCFLDNGWFFLDMPQMLKKKDAADKGLYFGDSLLFSLRQYFIETSKNGPTKSFNDCVVIFCHIYAHETDMSLWRDHDNLEYNQTMNSLTCFLLRDDDPKTCDTFVTSAIGKADRTHVYIVPRSELNSFLVGYYPVKYGHK